MSLETVPLPTTDQGTPPTIIAMTIATVLPRDRTTHSNEMT